MALDIHFREAVESDLLTIIDMLADDKLGSDRESLSSSIIEDYLSAFNKISMDINNELIVMVLDTEIVGTLQLTYIPSLTYQGGLRAQVEAVRIKKKHRGKGYGKQLINWAIKRSHDKGCHMVQLATNKERKEAILFYEKLGFSSSHEGMKLFV